jgi:hypothetical protein
MTFTVTIQSPFKSTTDIYSNSTASEAVLLFNNIDWAALWHTIMATGSSQESDYYYFEVNYNNSLGDHFLLHIACSIGEEVSLRFFRPKMIEKTVWFKKKAVWEPAFETQMDDVPVAFALDCLQAFLKEDLHYLEQHIVTQIRSNNS